MATVGERIQALVSSPDRLLWAVRVRWLAIAGFVPLAVVAHTFGLFASLHPVALVAGIGAALNAVNGWCVRQRRFVLLVSAVAIPMDHVFSTYLIVHTGGVQSPFFVVFAVQVVATAMLVDAAIAVASAVLAVVLWAIALSLQSAGLLVAPPLFAPEATPSPLVYHAAWAAFLFYCLMLLIYLGGYISERLRSSERLLEERNRSLEEAMVSLRAAHDELRLAYQRQQQTEAHLVHSEKMRGLGGLVAGIAHELNNPISFVAGNVEHLRDYIGRLLQLLDGYEQVSLTAGDRQRLLELKSQLCIEAIRADLPVLIEDCEEGARRTKQIVVGLRDFSRLDSGEAWQLADVRQGLDSTLALIGNRFRNRIAVYKEYGDVSAVECLPGQLNQVFMNVLVNAADACPSSAGEVWLKVTAATLGGQPAVEIAIHDNGTGIAPAVQSRIFEPFFTTKPVGQGTGLGLSVSYGIVQRHQGRLTVDSTLGQGSTFTITLPLRRGIRG